MTIKVGDTIPSMKLMQGTADGPKEISTDDIFKGKKVVLFSVPGAFTDAFVMGAWGKAQNSGDIIMLADGSAAFAKALGLELDLVGRGMGVRAQRFAFIADNGKVSYLAVEPAGQFGVSSAEDVMKHL
jgi:peroxiredoxin